MCSKSDVVKQLKVLLKGADLESTTEDGLKEQLTTHFQQCMDGYQDVIQNEVEAFVLSKASKKASKAKKENTKRAPLSRAAVAGQLQKLLQTADLESTSADRLKQQLESHFQQSVHEYEALIQQEVEAFVLSKASGAAAKSAQPAPPSTAAVVEHLKRLLNGADLETTTEEGLKAQLESDFQQNMDAYTPQIQAEVEKFVQSLSAPAPSLSPAGKRGRENYSAATASSKVPKAVKAEPVAKPAPAAKPAAVPQATSIASSPPGSVPDFALSSDGLTRCAVTVFKGKTYVDIRMKYEKNGELMNTKKGLMLSVADWHALCRALPQLAAALEAEDTSVVVPLSGTRRATVSNYKKGSPAVDVREWYESAGELKPGAKGVSLKAEAFQALQQCAAQVTAALPADTLAHTAEAPTATPPGPTAAAAAAAPPAGDTITGAGGERLWRLGGSGNKFVSAGEYKGMALVSLREYYQKDGAWLPGKKGISLNAEQFGILASKAEAVSAAVAANNLAFREDLLHGESKERRISLSEFKGKTLVGVREYYSKDGEWRPGSKGVSLTPDQWHAFVQVLPEVQAAEAKLR